MINYCPECGEKIEPGDKFCKKCGKPLNSVIGINAKKQLLLVGGLAVTVVVLAILLFIKNLPKKDIKVQEENDISAAVDTYGHQVTSEDELSTADITEDKQEAYQDNVDILSKIPQQVGGYNIDVSDVIVENKAGYKIDVRLGAYEVWVAGNNHDLISNMEDELGIGGATLSGNQFEFSNSASDVDLYYLFGFIQFVNLTDGYSLSANPQEIEYMIRIDHDLANYYGSEIALKKEVNEIMEAHEKDVAMKLFKKKDEVLYATELLGGLNIGEILCSKVLDADDIYIPFILAVQSQATPNNQDGEKWFQWTFLDIQVSDPLNSNNWLVVSTKAVKVADKSSSQELSADLKENTDGKANTKSSWLCTKEMWTNGHIFSKTEYTYDDDGNLSKRVCYSGGGESTETYTYEHENAGRISRINIDYNGTSRWAEYEYDNRGNKTAETYYDEYGDVERWETCEYDENDRLIYKKSQIYDGMVSRYRYEYGKNDRLIKEISIGRGDEITGWREYDYDSNGVVEGYTICDADGNVCEWSHYVYDNNGNRIREEIYDENGKIRAQYDYEYTLQP